MRHFPHVLGSWVGPAGVAPGLGDRRPRMEGSTASGSGFLTHRPGNRPEPGPSGGLRSAHPALRTGTSGWQRRSRREGCQARAAGGGPLPTSDKLYVRQPQAGSGGRGRRVQACHCPGHPASVVLVPWAPPPAVPPALRWAGLPHLCPKVLVSAESFSSCGPSAGQEQGWDSPSPPALPNPLGALDSRPHPQVTFRRHGQDRCSCLLPTGHPAAHTRRGRGKYSVQS